MIARGGPHDRAVAKIIDFGLAVRGFSGPVGGGLEGSRFQGFRGFRVLECVGFSGLRALRPHWFKHACRLQGFKGLGVLSFKVLGFSGLSI